MCSGIGPVVWPNALNDQMYVIRQIKQECLEYNKDKPILYIDFKKAYDSIYRVSLINILNKFKFFKTIINLIVARLKLHEYKSQGRE